MSESENVTQTIMTVCIVLKKENGSDFWLVLHVCFKVFRLKVGHIIGIL